LREHPCEARQHLYRSGSESLRRLKMDHNKQRTTPPALATAQLRRRAERRLKEKMSHSPKRTLAQTHRLVHELEVHQVELEMQNEELQNARDKLETALDQYSELYDFAPVGYFCLDPQGRILKVNLKGAALLGVPRPRLINRLFMSFVLPASRPFFVTFLERVFGATGEQVCEAALVKDNSTSFWGSFHGTSSISEKEGMKCCRVVLSDITSLKQAREAQRRMEALTAANAELRQEIIRREAVERCLQESKQEQIQLLQQSQEMHDELRLLSRQFISAQEEERKRISRELHDVIAQTLTSINLRLAALKTEAVRDPKSLEQSIGRTQEEVMRSVNIVHRFARQLRPAVLDDLGLVPALHEFLKQFGAETGVRVNLSAFSEVERVSEARRTVLYRVAHEAIANIRRHANASQVDVEIEKLDGALRMTIKDNGKGFQLQGPLRTRKDKRLGLLGMRERLEMLGGEFRIVSLPGKGTTVIAQIPLNDRTSRRKLSPRPLIDNLNLRVLPNRPN
jgi:PAS domain S-box-containing protein